jgi:DNA-binding transcriptional ArsR family regulator
MSTKALQQHSELDWNALEQIASVFRAFSEPSRLAILQELKGGPRCVGDLVSKLQMTQANVSKQLKMLYDLHLLDRQRKGNQVFYSVKDEVVYQFCELACQKLNRQVKEASAIEFSI